MGQVGRKRERIHHRAKSAAPESHRFDRGRYARSTAKIEWPLGGRQTSEHRWSAADRNQKVARGAGLSKTLAPRGDVHPDADRDLRDHRRIKFARRHSSRRRWGDCVDPGTCSRGDSPSQRGWTRADRPRSHAFHLCWLYPPTRRTHSGRSDRVSDRVANALRSRRSTLSLVIELHYSRDTSHGHVLYFCRWKRRASATVAREGGKGNAHRKNRDGLDSD